ncbi:hydantoinase B/oxoprolinase family protein [Frigidibacter sp. MR17.14]|uniref:hydantoinase B/oxoprolinase family protein n=1 Tax=Frigidibacter sp. MR17.14 TaxID=3126509 RepID=UPI003012AB25
MDGVELQILWSNMIGIVSEQARSLQRIAFSPIVREAGDLANGIFDARARMVAQAVTGTPGHINSLAAAARNLLGHVDVAALKPGDVLITNDPWMSAGHFFDITVLSPIFRGERLIGYAGSTIHHTDIGGYGIGSGARDIHEEGLWIPVLKLYEAGVPNATLFSMITRNVRTPDALLGDLGAQVSSGMIASQRLNALCDRYGLEDIEALSDEIIDRSEAATRAAIRALPGGTFHGSSTFDVPGGERVTLKTAVTIDAEAGEIVVDFEGSSGRSGKGINVVPAYAQAYATFAIRSTLNPDLPNNAGSLAPIRLKLPENCIVNATYPSPVNARHVVGMYVPFPILNALAQVVPDKVVAEGSGAVWTVQIQGRDREGRAFTSSMFNYSGGMGARAGKPGISAVCYPTGVSAVPVEVLEAAYPIEFTCKELERGSGGAGLQPGGDGQRIGFRMRTGSSWLLNTVPSRLMDAPQGLDGGAPGRAGQFLVNGKPVMLSGKTDMQAADEVTMVTPGGGGFGAFKVAKSA